MDELRAGTASLHRRAEESRFHADLVRGRVTRAAYGRYLAELYWVHETLESCLRNLALWSPAASGVLSTCQFHLDRLGDDTRFLIGDLPPPSPPTVEFRDRLARLARRSPVALLGAHYVFEGSKNGGRILARIVAQALALPAGQGTRYLDPYGDQQGDRWRAYKLAMNGCSFEPRDRSLMLATAGEAFEYVGRLSEELTEPRS